MELEYCINYALTRAQNIVHQIFKAELAPYGITPGQYGVLKCLWDENGQTVKQLAERLYLDSSTITGLLDRMEQKNLVKRLPSPHDRRALSVVLTEEGQKLEDPVNQAIEKANKRVLQSLSKEDAENLRLFLLEISSK
mgnify:CR=1 FL=1